MCIGHLFICIYYILYLPSYKTGRANVCISFFKGNYVNFDKRKIIIPLYLLGGWRVNFLFFQTSQIQQKYFISSKTLILTLKPYSNQLHFRIYCRVLHIKSSLKLEKNKINNTYNVKRNRKHIDSIELE